MFKDGKLDLGTFKAKVATSEIQLEGAQITGAELTEEVAEISLVDGKGNPYIVKVPAKAFINSVGGDNYNEETKEYNVEGLTIDALINLLRLDDGVWDSWRESNIPNEVPIKMVFEGDIPENQEVR